MKISILVVIAIILIAGIFIIPKTCASSATRLKWEWHNTPLPKPNFVLVIKINSIKGVFDIIGKIFWASTTEYSAIKADVIKDNKKKYGNSIYIWD